MGYNGSNAEFLNRMSLYDLLCRIQREPQLFCSIEKITGDMKATIELCEEHGCKCEICIAEWLSKKHE